MSGNVPYGAIGSKFGVQPTGFFFDRLQEIKTMTVYVIADIKVTNEGWIPAYAASVHELVHKHGGKYLSCSGNVKTQEIFSAIFFGFLKLEIGSGAYPLAPWPGIGGMASESGVT